MELKLRACGHRELERIYSLFDLDFDKKELLPRLGIHKAMLKGDMELLAVTDEESRLDLAYALVGCRSLYGYIWLKYLDVIPFYREKGLGVQAMRLLNKRFADRQGIVAEITDFDPEGEGDAQRKQHRRGGTQNHDFSSRFFISSSSSLTMTFSSNGRLIPMIS